MISIDLYIIDNEQVVINIKNDTKFCIEIIVIYTIKIKIYDVRLNRYTHL